MMIRRAFICGLAVLLLGSCAGGAGSPVPSPSAQPTVPPTDSPDPLFSPNPLPSAPQNPSSGAATDVPPSSPERLDVGLAPVEPNWPGTLTPLVSPMGTDGYGIYGPLAFYDHRSGGLLKPDADTYYPLYDAEKCILCGYAIYGDTGKAAIMSLYGEVLSDFVYSAKIGGDGIITWETRNGFAVVADSDAETQKFGAADLRSGGAAIAPVYDEISLYEDFAIGTLDGVYYILSYQGETLLTSNTPPVNGAYGGYDLPPGPTPTSQFFTADSGNTLIYLESSYELPAAAEDMLKYTQQTAETLGGQYDDVDVSFSYYAAATKGETIDIYFQNPGGPALIMENVYGYVWDLNSLYGVLVYKDAVTCGFLDSGGQFNEIPIDFSVESRFLEYYW